MRPLRQLVLATLVLPFLSVPSAAAAPPPEVLAWTTSAGAWVAVGDAPGTLVVPGALDVDVSPDGTRLAYVKDTPDGSGRPGYTTWQLWVAHVDGTSAVDLTPGNDGRNSYAYQPQFSPDGSRIAYAWGGGDVFDVRTISVTGGTPHDLPSTDQTQMPTWSPDGAFLAAPSPPGGLVVLTPDGLQRSRLGATGTFTGDPAWSPDGTRVLYSTTVYGNGAPTHDLYALAVATGTATLVAAGAQDAAWAPDGSRFYDQSAAGELERRTAEGVVDPTFAAVAGADNPSVGGGARPSPESTPPSAVTDLAAAPSPSQVTLTATLPADPDIAGVVVRYAAGAEAPADVTAGQLAGRGPSGAFVVRRLLPDTAYSFSVFAIDWSGNVSAPVTVSATTPHPVVTTFRTRTSREGVTYGDAVTESARLIREDTGAFVPGALVQLLGHTKGQPDKLLATARTDAQGLVQFVRRPLATATYTLRYAGDGQLQPGSGSHNVKVAFRIIAGVDPHIARRGTRAVYDITVLPAVVGRQLTVAQVRLSDQRTLRITSFRLDRYGRARVLLDTRSHGNEYLYTYVAPLDDYAARDVRLGFGVA